MHGEPSSGRRHAAHRETPPDTPLRSLTVLALQNRHRRAAALHEDLIALTLQKIRELNAARLEMMPVRLPYYTAKDLERDERQLGLGQTLDVATVPEIDLPDA